MSQIIEMGEDDEDARQEYEQWLDMLDNESKKLLGQPTPVMSEFKENENGLYRI